MASSEILTRLASNLPLEERHQLLERLKGQSVLTSDPLYFEEAPQKNAQLDLKGHYGALPWYMRFWYFLKSIFGGKSPIKVFEDQYVADLGKKIEEAAPGIFDYKRIRLLPPFHQYLTGLKEAARFFFDALDMGFNKDKGAFYAFLGSLEMPAVHKKLSVAANPASFAEQQPNASDSEIRRLCFETMEKALDGVTDNDKLVMYTNARSLLCLKQLSSFLFDRMLMAFTNDPAIKGNSCPLGTVRDQLINLNNILFSLRNPPSMSLLGSLFIFVLQDKAAEPDFDINRGTGGLLKKTETSLGTIREFNKNIPLTRIIRCGLRDMTVIPREIPGGEDWYMAYREHWKRFIEAKYSDFVKGRRHDELKRIFSDFFKGKQFRTIEHSASDDKADGFPLRGNYSLSFLLTFFTVVFLPELNMLLRVILVDGEFARKENELDFADWYNDFIRLENDIQRLDAKISPSGDIGKRYSLANQEVTALPVKRRKLQIIIEEAAGESLGIIDTTKKASKGLIDIINGILLKDSRGAKYEGLVNYDALAAREMSFAENLEAATLRFKSVIKILDDIDIMETG